MIFIILLIKTINFVENQLKLYNSYYIKIIIIEKYFIIIII